MRLTRLLHLSIIVIVILATSSTLFNVLLASAEEDGADSSADYQLFEASGTLSAGYYPFAGGGSCCGCGTRHFGVLPDNFEERDIESVTFFLIASRSDSHYLHIAVGSNLLKLTLTDDDPVSPKSYSAIASSMELKAGHGFPITINPSWYITFQFEDTIANVGPGWQWKLDDGDSNPESAVWLHMSDVDSAGLPGTAETYGCEYNETRSAHYSVMFSGSKSQSVTPSPSPTPVDILIQAEDYDSAKNFNLIDSGTKVQSTATNAELSYDFDVPNKACHVLQMRLRLNEDIIAVYIDGNSVHRGEIPAGGQLSGNPYTLGTWDTWDIGLGELSAGSHTLKVKAVSHRHTGQEFDWYRISSLSQSPVRLPSTYHEQETSMSCFAAVAHSFILDYGGENISEIDFCIDTFGQTKGRTFYKTGMLDTLWFFDNYEKGLEKYTGLTLTRDDTITWDEIVDSIDKGRPIITAVKMSFFLPGASGGHFVQIMGYGREVPNNVCSDWQQIYILNPSQSSGNPYTAATKFRPWRDHYMSQKDIDDYLYAAWRVK